jgi:hypothetical protein
MAKTNPMLSKHAFIVEKSKKIVVKFPEYA